MTLAPSHRSKTRRTARALAILIVCAGASACERAPVNEICPRVEPGDLVISELRGTQPEGEDDSFGHYVELYNASGRTLDLQGVVVRFVATNGDEQLVIVRESLELLGGDYAVLAPSRDQPTTWIDYGVGWDIGGDTLILAPPALVEVESCDVLIDIVDFGVHTVPELGTWACGNAEMPPDAQRNDDLGADCWCTDAEPSDVPISGVGLPGTPGRANRCP